MIDVALLYLSFLIGASVLVATTFALLFHLGLLHSYGLRPYYWTPFGPKCRTCKGTGWIITSYLNGPEFECSCPNCNDATHTLLD